MKPRPIKEWFAMVADPGLRLMLLSNCDCPDSINKNLWKSIFNCEFWCNSSTTEGNAFWIGVCAAAVKNEIPLLDKPDKEMLLLFEEELKLK